jgi:uncharacterized repeat protein (TIGR01451 family)
MFPRLLNELSSPIRWRIIITAVLSMWCAGFAGAASAGAAPAQAASKASGNLMVANYAKIPLSFEANQGQSDAQVKFLSRGDGYQLFLTPNAAVFELRTPAGAKSAPAVFQMELLHANRGARISGTDQLPGVVNYFIGNDPKKWRSGVSTYGKVRYEGIYAGVDAVFYGNQRQLEYDFAVAPGADPNQIALGLTGAKPSLDADGNVVLKLTDGDLALNKPVVYQNIDGHKKPVDASYLISGNTVRFRLGNYDRSQTLVIDPTFTYLTYLGGSNADRIGAVLTLGQLTAPNQALAMDSAGNVYVTGMTLSSDFPTASGFQTSSHTTTWSAFVSAIDPSGTTLLYSTYLGGSDYNGGNSIAWDSADNSVYVVGTTVSTDFPTTVNAFERSEVSPGQNDAFVAKFSSSGQLTDSTYLGTNAITLGIGVASDSQGRAYVTGFTQFNCPSNPALCFPTTQGAFIPAGTGEQAGDGFVSVFDPNLATLLYSTLLGDPNDTASFPTEAFGVTVDATGNFYVVGSTGASNLPTTPGAFQPTIGTTNNTPSTGFAAKFGPIGANGASITYLTYLGGPTNSFVDVPGAVAADSQGNAYIGGYTGSSSFPVTPGAYQTTCNFLECSFVTKLNPSGTGLVWSTFVAAADYFAAIQLDVLGNVYITGHNTGAFPTVNAVQPSLNQGGGFVAKLDPTGSNLLFSSLIGGSDGQGSSSLTGVAVDPLGVIYIAGNINDNTLPVTLSAVQSTFAGGSGAFGDGLIGKIHVETPSLNITKTHVGNFTQGQTGATYTITVSNSGDAPTSGSVTVTEAVPAGLTLQSMSGTGWTCATLPTCSRADALAINGSYPPITATVDVASNAPGILANLASVSGGGAYFTGNETASDSTNIVQSALPDMTVAVSNSSNFAQGQAGAIYTVTATNSGTGSSSGLVSVSDTVPAGLTLVSMAGPGWTCTTLPTCTRTDSLTPGSSYPPITVTVNVASNAAASVTDSATVSGGGETNTSNDTGSVVTTVNGPPDFTISKSHSGNFSQGQNGATYTITASNAGTSPSTGTVTVSEAIPAGLTLVSMSGPGWTCAALPVCTRTDSLPAGSSYPAITATVNVAANAPATVTNAVSVAGGGEVNTANDAANDATTISVVVQSQTITFPPIATQTYPVAPITLNATASSGLAVSYTASGPATVSGNILTITGGGSVTVQATQAGNANYSPAAPVSQTFVVNQAPSITSGNNATFVFGTAGSFTVNTSGFPAPSVSESGALPGNVTFVNHGNGSGTLSGPPAAVGTFPISFTASNGVGTPATQSFTLTVSPASTVTTAQAASATFSASAQSVTLSATVTSTTGVVNSGTVTFTVPGVGTATSGAVSGGSASATLTIPGGTVGGSYTIQAVYSGTTNLSSSTDSSKALTVSGLAATTVIVASSNAHYSLAAQPVTFNAEVLVGGLPLVNGGTVTFTVSGIGSVTSGIVSNGQVTAVLTLPPGQAGGSYTMTATYSGSANYAGSSSPTNTLFIFAASTTTTAQSASLNISFSHTVTLNATVTSPAGTVNGGIVNFTVGLLGVLVTSGPVTGGSASAVYTVPAGTAPGVYPIQATYQGTPSLNPSFDNSHTLTLTSTTQPTTTVATGASVTYSPSAQTVVLHASVSGGSSPINGGTFTFKSLNFGSVTSGPVVNGSATATLTLPAQAHAGTYNGTASYSGTLGFAASTANFTIVIVPAVPVVTWPTPAAITYPTQLSATQLDATANVPGKFVYSPAAGTVVGGGTQTLNATFTPGNVTDYSTVTAHVSIVVNKAVTMLTLYPPNDFGGWTFAFAGLTLPGTSPLFHAPSTGSLTVTASTGESCTVAVGLVNWFAACKLTFKTPGLRTLTATYSGDNNTYPSVSAPVQFYVRSVGGGG